MRIAYLGSFENKWDTESYCARALERLGHKVLCMNEQNYGPTRLLDDCVTFHPDLVLFAKGRLVGQWDPSTIALRDAIKEVRRHVPGVKVACWVFDLLCSEFNHEREEWAKNIDKFVEVLLTTDGYTATRLHYAHVLRQGMPDDVRPGVPQDKWRCDVLWLGGAYRQRCEPVRELAKHFGDRFLHVPEGVRGPDLCDLIASAKIVLGPVFPSFPNYWSNRAYIVCGCGGFFLAPEVIGMSEEGWVASKHYAAYPPSGFGLIGIIELWLKPEMETERKRIAIAGQKLCRERFTYDHRCAELVGIIQHMPRREVK